MEVRIKVRSRCGVCSAILEPILLRGTLRLPPHAGCAGSYRVANDLAERARVMEILERHGWAPSVEVLRDAVINGYTQRIEMQSDGVEAFKHLEDVPSGEDVPTT